MFVLLAVLSGFSVFAICTTLQKSQPGGLLPEKRQYGGFIIGGITVVALGVGVFLLTPLRNENFRTYYFSSLGAGVAVVALVGWLTMVVLRRPVFFAICVGVLCAIASLHMLDQHRTFYLRSEQQQALATALVNTLHGIERGNAVIMLDESEERELASIIGSSWTTQNIVRMLY
jgi:hypothetical protein